MRTLPFVKMHGIGNDYVYVDAFAHAVTDAPTLARLVSDRHRGIGSDGLILVAPPGCEGADVRMRMFNADGSEGRMCGNGIRCVAKFVVDRGLCRTNPLRVQTGRGVLAVTWRTDEGGCVCGATVDMGEPILEPSLIPVDVRESRAIAWPWGVERWRDVSAEAGLDAEQADAWIDASGIGGTVSFVSMGNPHMVAWCDSADAVPLERIGPVIERMGMFPERINVHVVQTTGAGEVRMRTWERGSGITQACGTGACAVCVAGQLEGRLCGNVRVHLPGGTLRVEWPGGTAPVMMTGPAVTAFEGTLDLDAIGAPSGVVHAAEGVA
jgi:diaminopimelate epimerase